MKQFQKDSLRVYACKTRAEMGKVAADRCEYFIRQMLREREEINMIFAAAPSQNDMLAELITRDIDFGRIHAFHMDEYVGLRPTDRQSFASYLTEHLFSKVSFRSVNLIDTSNGADAACARYTELLERFPPDIVCMGIGENGHIAFNDPPVADFHDPFAIKRVELDPICRQQQVNDKCFDTLDEVPTHAVTLTVPTLVSAKHLICTVPAPTKAKAVRAMLCDEISTACPCTILRTHPSAELFLDADSAALLEV